MSRERVGMLEALGAEVRLTPAHLGMQGAISAAQEIVTQNEGAFMPQQFNNKNNPAVHRETTAIEIWNDTEGKIDIFVAGVGTGGTISGVGQVLKEKNPNVKIIAVEPEASPVLSGGEPGPHQIQGIGAGFIPGNFNGDVVDEVVKVSNEDAKKMTKALALKEGIFAGISSGGKCACSFRGCKTSRK